MSVSAPRASSAAALNIESFLSDLGSLDNPDVWREAVAAVAAVLESEEPVAVARLCALRTELAPQAAYALDRALRQANSVVPMTIEGAEVWLELVMLPIHLRNMRGPDDQSLSAPNLDRLTAVERALEAALSVGFASARLLPFAVDPKQLDGLDPYKTRLAMQQLGTFGDTTYLQPAQLTLDSLESGHWWFWPVTVQHVQRPQVLLNGVGAAGQPHWQRAAQLLEEKLMAWLLASPASGHVTVRQPVSWAEAAEQLQRYKVLSWLSQLQSTREEPWQVEWTLDRNMLTLFASRAGRTPQHAEFLFKAGQDRMVHDMLAKLATRFPGQLQAAPALRTAVPGPSSGQ